jgi:Glycosyltransferase GT-D fold
VYPAVAGEFETISKLLKGFSISRFGDGECKVMDRHVYTRELVPVPKLANEMKRIAANPHSRCLLGIPTMDPRGTKYANWLRHARRFEKYFNTGTGLRYWSALITRPDCGEWLETRAYYEHVIRLWADKSHVAVVSEADSKLLSFLRLTHAVTHVECPMYGAYAEIGRLEREVLESKPELAVLSAGPTATVLAHRLTKHGIQALDLGSIGGFLHRWRENRPRPDNYHDERYGPQDHAAGVGSVYRQGQ